jgi:undecaprenyl-diphosphatase
MFSIFKNINRFAGNYKAIDILAIFGARYLMFLILAFIFAYSLALGNFGIFILALSSAVFATFGINGLIQYFYREKRPAVFKSAKVIIPVPKNPSFPSNHSAFSFAMAFSTIFFDAGVFWALFFCAFVVGICRVFCGVHWARDIVGGAFSGFISVLLIYYIALYI